MLLDRISTRSLILRVEESLTGEDENEIHSLGGNEDGLPDLDKGEKKGEDNTTSKEKACRD